MRLGQHGCRGLCSVPGAGSELLNSTGFGPSMPSFGPSPPESLNRFFSAVSFKQRSDLRTAQQKAAAASYVGSALRGFGEVEDALASDYYLRQRESALGDAVSSSGQAVDLGGKPFEQGQIDMFIILRLTGENLAAKVQLTELQASRLRERVNLYLALGGDFAGTGAPK